MSTGDLRATLVPGADVRGEAASFVRLPRQLGRRLEELARRAYPNEACGLLIGRQQDGGTEVERLQAARNRATGRLRDRYLLDPGDHLAADEAARRAGLDIVGIWHTHPDHPAEPSETDLKSAWAGYAYLILSVTPEGVADARAWRLAGCRGRAEEARSSRFVEQPIVIEEAEEERT